MTEAIKVTIRNNRAGDLGCTEGTVLPAGKATDVDAERYDRINAAPTFQQWRALGWVSVKDPRPKPAKPEATKPAPAEGEGESKPSEGAAAEPNANAEAKGKGGRKAKPAPAEGEGESKPSEG